MRGPLGNQTFPLGTLVKKCSFNLSIFDKGGRGGFQANPKATLSLALDKVHKCKKLSHTFEGVW